MNTRKLERFDGDLIAHATVVRCPDKKDRVFAGFDEDGDLAVVDRRASSGVVYFHAETCMLIDGGVR